MTFFSYEKLLELKIIRPTHLFGSAKLIRGAGAVYKAVPMKLQTILKCQTTGQTKLVQLTGQAVRDWHTSPYASIKFNESEHSFERIGVVGRNLLIENKLSITLDGWKRQTRIT